MVLLEQVDPHDDHEPEEQGDRYEHHQVRVLDQKGGTCAKVRVLIETSDHKESWFTVGVSENIIEASWQALRDSANYKLFKSGITAPTEHNNNN